MDRLATPALPARSSSPTRHTGAKSGLTAYKTTSTSGCPQRAAEPTTLRLKYDPATPRDGAKGFRTRLTPLQLRESSRRGWPDGPQRVTAEEEDRDLQPGDGECKTVRRRHSRRTFRASLQGQDSTNNRLATPALPARSSSPTRHAGAKSGSTAYKMASTSGCLQRAAGPTTLRLKYDPATPRDGAKGFRTRLTPLQLRESGRRGWPDGPQRVTAEEEDRDLQPGDGECKTVRRRHSRRTFRASLQGQDSTNNRLATPALPARSSSPTWHAGAKSGLTAYKTASTSGCP